MQHIKFEEFFKSKNGFLVATIEKLENGRYLLFERSRLDYSPGNNHSAIGTYDELDHARQIAQSLVAKYEQTHS